VTFAELDALPMSVADRRVALALSEVEGQALRPGSGQALQEGR
jgi:hypothetical protein